jgi:ABC-2 type transport system ATP-binding protein
LIEANGLLKLYGKFRALDGFDLSVTAGQVVGLIGPNGAGKTTALKAIVGLTGLDGGHLQVVGLDPRRERQAVMARTGYIAELGTLPRWMRVGQVVTYLAGVHPAFERERAEAALADAGVHSAARIGTLSKGMAAELHLALILALDVDLLILDEPTLGLDIINRERFYERLANDWFGPDRAVLVTSHEVREIEHLLTDVVFIHRGQTLLAAPMQALATRFHRLDTDVANAHAARRLRPLADRATPAGATLLYDGIRPERLEELGTVSTPSLPEVFVALVGDNR